MGKLLEAAVIYDEGFGRYDLGAYHPLKPIRWKLTFELMKALGLLTPPSFGALKPKPASREDVLLFHSPDYVERVEKFSTAGRGLLDAGDTPAFKGCFDAACLAVGGSLEAVDTVVGGEASCAFNLGGGFHHAHPDRASGFCIFNDVAVAILHLKLKRGLRRFLYLDIDAHHGDGVMYGFYSDPSVLNIDFHETGRYLFPGTGFTHEVGDGNAEGYKVNVPLPPHTGDNLYLKAFREIVPPLVHAYKPEIILLQCGADGHFRDPLTQLDLTTTTYSEVASMVRKLADEVCGGRVVMFGGGGYDTANTARCWAIMLGKVAGVELPDRIPPSWVSLCETFGELRIPKKLYDSSAELKGERSEDAESEVEDILKELRKRVFPVFGLG